MKYLKLFEGFKLVDLKNSRWYGNAADDKYIDRVKDECLNIAMEELQVSEKAFSMVDRLMDICKKTMNERDQEFDAIVHNCKQRNMRPKYAAESVFHTILQGRLNSLTKRPFVMGGLKLDEGLTYSGGDVTKMPIIGEVTTTELKWGDHTIPSVKEKVVEIIDGGNGKKVYVLNRWNEKRIPQLIHEDMVEKYKAI